MAKLEHIGVVVQDLEASLKPYREFLGLQVKETETLDVQGALTKVAFLPTAGINVELVWTSAQSGLAADFLRTKGEGIHHLAFEVEDLDQTFAELRVKGVKFVWDKIITGSRGSRVAFFEAQEFNGVYIELVQKH